MTLKSPSPALLRESAVFAERLLTRWLRHPLVPLQSLLFPTILLFVYYMLVSTSMTRLTGNDRLGVVVAMCALAGGMSGSLAAASSMPAERDSGLLSRFWTMPVTRASALAGTLAAEALRTLVATAVITLVGVALGLRIHGGIIAALAFIAIPVLWVTTYALVVVAVALRFESRTILNWFSTLPLGLVFGSSAVAPIDLFPTWTRAVVRAQPMTPTIEAMTSLARGEVPAVPLALSLAWMTLIGFAVGTYALRVYRRAAQTG